MPNDRLAIPAIVSPMLIDAVAAGEGALSTCTIRSASTIRKSSSRAPSGSSAWARTPAPLGCTSCSRELGNQPLQRLDERPLAERPVPLAEAIRQYFAAIRQKPQ